MYDLFLVIAGSWFVKMREDQGKQEEGFPVLYSLLLFSILFIVEFCPILMFTLNLRFVFHHQAELKPKMVSQQPHFQFESPPTRQSRPEGAALLKAPEAYRESLLSDGG